MITINELNAKYKSTNPAWDFLGIEPWLIKKGIEPDITDLALEKALVDFTQETLPETNFIFDNTVYLMALILKENLRKERYLCLQKERETTIKNYDAEWNKLSKSQKIWQVIIGKA